MSKLHDPIRRGSLRYTPLQIDRAPGGIRPNESAELASILAFSGMTLGFTQSKGFLFVSRSQEAVLFQTVPSVGRAHHNHKDHTEPN